LDDVDVKCICMFPPDFVYSPYKELDATPASPTASPWFWVLGMHKGFSLWKSGMGRSQVDWRWAWWLIIADANIDLTKLVPEANLVAKKFERGAGLNVGVFVSWAP
jgi:hypothetical protein